MVGIDKKQTMVAVGMAISMYALVTVNENEAVF
jgi:hypothetical protein